MTIGLDTRRDRSIPEATEDHMHKTIMADIEASIREHGFRLTEEIADYVRELVDALDEQDVTEEDSSALGDKDDD